MKIILGIETSCDETAAAVLKQDGKGIQILSNIVASSALLQSKYGGIIPEQAAREQLKSIIPVIEESLQASGSRPQDIDAIAVTYGPGLIGSLLVGVETAKVLAKIWNKPLIPINHLIGHFYANWINNQNNDKKQKNHNSKFIVHNSIPSFPCLGLLVSGGHTDLVLFANHGKYKYLGGTRDDAAGECFDKCARLLGLPYPGGPQISKLARLASRAKRAQTGDPAKFKLPLPMKDNKDFDFSYSGLKTAVANLMKSDEIRKSDAQTLSNLSASIEDTIVKSLVDKVIMAIQKYKVEQVMVAGGVAANQKLAAELKLKIENLKLKIALHIPPPSLCTDNGAMIAAAGFFEEKRIDPLNLEANPNLSLDNS